MESIDVDPPVPPAEEVASDWTVGPAKWAAIFVLGAAAIACTVWSIALRERPRADARTAAVLPSGLSSSPAIPAAAPGAGSVGEGASAVRPAPAPTPVLPAGQVAASPQQGPPAVEPAATKPAPVVGGALKINLNTANQAQLELLPGIGPALALRIIEYRTTSGLFKRIDDLDNVKGIGPARLEKLRPLVTVE